MERSKMEGERPKVLDGGMLRYHGGWRTKGLKDADYCGIYAKGNMLERRESPDTGRCSRLSENASPCQP